MSHLNNAAQTWVRLQRAESREPSQWHQKVKCLNHQRHFLSLYTQSSRGRVVKASDSKSDSLWERRFESCRLRIFFALVFCLHLPLFSWRCWHHHRGPPGTREQWSVSVPDNARPPDTGDAVITPWHTLSHQHITRDDSHTGTCSPARSTLGNSARGKIELHCSIHLKFMDRNKKKGTESLLGWFYW